MSCGTAHNAGSERWPLAGHPSRIARPRRSGTAERYRAVDAPVPQARNPRENEALMPVCHDAQMSGGNREAAAAAWRGVVAWCAERAPATAARLHGPADDAALAALQD